jgi:hypothetical protein
MFIVLMLAVALSQVPDAPVAKRQAPPPSSAALELQGDKLGESFDTFMAQHPKAQCDTSQTPRAVCYQWADVAIFGLTAFNSPTCTLKKRYAADCIQGITAKFTERRLVSLVYTVAGIDKSAPTAALQDKLGAPAMNSSDGTIWNRGEATASVMLGKASEERDAPTLITISISTTN